MRTTPILLVLTLFAGDVALAGAAPRPSWTHTRPLTPGAIRMLADATERSSIVRTLLQDLEQTDIVVYLTDSMAGTADEPATYLGFLSRAAGTRYLLIRIDRWRLPAGECIVWLGHELQHAIEIAAAPDVKDAAGLAKLYRHIGWEGQKGRFESAGAQTIGNRVRDQLAGYGH